MTTSAIHRKSALTRWFFPCVAVLLVALTLWGFKDFYFHARAHPNREITPPIRGLVITHGIAMAAWMLIFLTQPFLIATSKRKAHMALGRIGAVVAGVVFTLGMIIAVYSTRSAPPGNMLWGLEPKAFMAVPFIGMLLFGAFVGAGIYYRRRPAIHRAMMLTGTFSAMAAAISRIDPLSNLYAGTVWQSIFGPFFISQLLMGAVLLVRCAVTRSIDRWLTFGFITLTTACAGIMWLARTTAWDSFASTLVP